MKWRVLDCTNVFQGSMYSLPVHSRHLFAIVKILHFRKWIYSGKILISSCERDLVISTARTCKIPKIRWLFLIPVKFHPHYSKIELLKKNRFFNSGGGTSQGSFLSWVYFILKVLTRIIHIIWAEEGARRGGGRKSAILEKKYRLVYPLSLKKY